ncbi:PhnD/SsuA/transferrin family substrate-binding protein [Halorhabdus tiamatea]|uniref:ABC-type phosphate/phosphonate transport system, substrate-binding protein n=2 Tax=Halorhabdus tiamatea SARL4B TaxID=1033806 RepID=F7PPQ4_9EURY|nr:PhnD/SsuA/transferrin family substrate-binding protein [Halorhabdus tiamatea]CCQ32257.1 ABC-type phosphate/phosphonate transport system, substrate-binding protein [Halorhabdus tiamatea SARL4B]
MAGVAGCLGSSQGSAADDETVTFLLKPVENPQDMKAQYEPVKKHLEAEVDGITVETPVSNGYSGVERSLKSGRAELSIGDVVAFSFPDLVDVLGTQYLAGASSFYFSMLVTKPEYNIGNLTDLKGTEISFCDVLSTSGSVYPLSALEEAGLDIGDAPTGDPVDFSGTWSNHDQSFRTFIDRENIKANANYGKPAYPYLTESHLQDIGALDRITAHSPWADKIGTKTDEQELEIAWISERVPYEPVITRAGWDSPKREAVEQTLLEMTASDLEEYRSGEDVSLPMTGLTDTSMEDYEAVRRRVTELGVLESKKEE